MKQFACLFPLFVAFLIVACTPKLPSQPIEDESPSKKTYLETGKCKELTYDSIRVSAETNVNEDKYESVEYGFLYSTDKDALESQLGEIVWSDQGERDEDDNSIYTYYATLTDLEPEEVYYYCAMVCLNESKYKYGEIKEFTTSAAPEEPEDPTNPEDPNEPENPNDPLAEYPQLESPGYGKVTIALRAPEGTCNGMVAVGAATNWDGSDDWDPSAQDKPFTKVDGTDNWYQITLPANYGMAVKVIAVSSSGRADWNTQWGMNRYYEDPNVVILAGEGYLDNSENSGEVKLMELVENTVVYIDVLAWKSEPCVSRNSAGWATFYVTVPYNTPSNAQVSIAGSFDENAWTPGAYILTRQDNGTYYGEFYIPEAFQYKYIIGFEGLAWSWGYEEVIAENRVMPLNMCARDVVEEWSNIPEDPNTGETTGWENGHEFVNLGLPSGLLWATCNVGAVSPEGYGDYFAWGETHSKDYYDWSTYKWCDGTFDTQNKYCTDSYYGYVDNKTTLDYSDDAAAYNWGGAWRMPTDEELNELINNCSWSWTNFNGVNGFMVTGPNGNSIFLPAAGYRTGYDLRETDAFGIYWSTALNANEPMYADALSIYDGRVYKYGYDPRYYGRSVRPVFRK